MGIRRLVVAGVTVALALLPASASAAQRVVVAPGHMHGWVFFDDNTNGPGTGHMVTGPGDPPLGKGSAELAVLSPADRQALGTQAYQGTPLKDIKRLSYWTYQVDPTHAITLQFDIRFHPADTGYQGRLVFEPGYYGNGVAVSGTWQQWTPLTGRWWASRPASSGGMCSQATPCTWQEVLANWPDASVLKPGNLLFKAGGGWATWKGNVDAFTIAVQGRGTTTYDFEPARGEGDGGDGGDGGEGGGDGAGGDSGQTGD